MADKRQNQFQNQFSKDKNRKDSAVDALKVPPHSFEAEQSVLGGLFIDNEAWDRVTEFIVAKDFYSRPHQLIFEAMAKLVDQHIPLDIITVSEWLDNEELLDDAGGFAYLGDIVKNTPSASNITAYANIVRERAVIRELIAVASEITESGYEPQGRKSTDLLDLAESKVFQIAESRQSEGQGPKNLESVLQETVDKIEELYQTPHDGVTGVASGYGDLDGMTTGFQPSDLIIVAARPSMGKCIVSGSRVLDPLTGQLHSIDELVANEQANLATVNSDYTLSVTQASAFVDDGMKPVFKVKTALGREISTTLTHPFLTGNGWLPLEDISVGEKIAVPRELPYFGDKAMPEHEVKALAYFIADGGTTQSNPMFTNVNPVISQDFINAIEQFDAVSVKPVLAEDRTPSFRVSAETSQIEAYRSQFSALLTQSMAAKNITGNDLAGILSVSKASVSQWCNGHCVPEQDTLTVLLEKLEFTLADADVPSYTAMAKNSINSVTEWLVAHGLWHKSALEKTIPTDVYCLPKLQLALFINRLFSCDGSAFVQANSQARLSYASSSYALVHGLQHLLLRFGIIAKVREKTSKYDGATPYELEILDQQSILTFISEIGIFAKEQALADVSKLLADKAQHTNKDTMPESVNQYILLKKADRSWRTLFNAAGKEYPEGYNPHLQGESARGISRHRLALFAELLKDDYLQQLSQSDLYWDEIVAIEHQGDKQVYDLTVPDTHNFIAEDICIHNTTFAMNLCEHAALNEDKPAVIFSLEMPAEQIMMRMLASLGKINQTKVRTGQLDDDDWARLSATMKSMLEQGKMYIDDSSGLTPTEVRSRSRRIARDHGGISMIMIDYLQLMRVPALSENRTLEIAEISRSLKSLAKELKCPVIALSQLNRSLEQRADKRPVNSDLRESGSIEQDADLIMFIYRDEVYNDDSPDKGTAEIIIGKQRNGPIGKVRLTFNGEFSRFDNFTGPAYDDDY